MKKITEFIIVFITLVLIFLVLPKSVLANQNLVVPDDAADGAIYGDGTFFGAGEDSNGGAWAGAWPTTSHYWGFTRFTLGSAIPNGTTISNATLELYGYDLWNWDTDGDYLHIHVTDSADGGLPADGDDRPTPDGDTAVYPTVGSGTRWPTASGGLNWSTSGWNTSVDISSLIQHLVDENGGLAQNSHIVVWFDAPGSDSEEVGWRDWYYNSGACADHACAAKLNMTYSEGPTPTPTLSPTPTNSPTPTPTPMPEIPDFSLSAWVNPTTSIASKAIIVKNNEIRMFTDNNSKLNCQIHNGSDWQTAATSATALSTGSWQHVSCTFDLDRNLRVFINGVQDGIQVQSAMTVNNTANNIRFGSDAGGTYSNFSGNMDETRMYNRALTPGEIKQLYILGLGPVGWWKMDEGSGSTTYDSSGNNNNSTTWTSATWVTGKFGSGISVNGSNQVVRMAETTSIDLGNTTDSYTLSAWFKTTANYSDYSIIATKYNALAGLPFAILLDSNEYGCFAIAEGGAPIIVCGTTTLNDGVWHYISGIRDVSTDSLLLYIDGVLINSIEDTSSTDMRNDSDFSVGNGGSSYNTYDFNGQIDDVKLYNYVRTPSQIIEDMNAGHPAPGSPVGSPIGYWKLDEGNGDTAYDLSSQTNNGDLSGTTTCPSATICPTWSNLGKLGKALYFGGLQTANGDSHMRLSNDVYDSQTQGSISMWFKADDTGDTDQNLFQASEELDAGNTDLLGIQLNISNNTISYGAYDNGPLVLAATSQAINNLTSWHHLLLNMGPSGNELYIDGVKQTLTYGTGTASTDVWFDDISDNTTVYTFGCGITTTSRDENDCYDSELYQGYLDDIKIYSFPLTADQVKAEYNQGKSTVLGAVSTDASGNASWSDDRSFCPPGDTTATCAPVGYWKMDENTGIYAYDGSGYDIPNELYDGPTWTVGKFGSAVKFDGDNDLVGNDSALDHLTNLSQFSISAWIYPKSGGEGNTGIILSKEAGGDSYGWNFGIRTINYWPNLNIARGTQDFIVTSSSSVTLNTWQHVEAVWDGTLTATNTKLYINGVLVGHSTDQNGSGTRDDDTGTPIIIGNDPTQAQTFEGFIDDVRIYNYARTQAQVAWDYSKGAPVGWWKFDECTGTSIYDTSLTGNGVSAGKTGTWSGSGGGNTSAGSCPVVDTATAWYNGKSGKFNNALDFDGGHASADDKVAVTNASSIDLNEGLANGFTVSTWIYPQSDGEGDAARIFEKGTSNYCKLGSESGSQATVSCRIDLSTDAEYSATTKVNINQWNHIAFSWNNDADDEVTIWVNGVANTSSATFDGDAAAESSDLTIGNAADGSATYDGKIDNFKIFNYELTAQQVKTEYNGGASVYFGGPTPTPTPTP